MKLPSITTLSVVMLASEISLVFARRSKTRSQGKDRLTLPLLWIVITLSVSAGFFCRLNFPQGRLPLPFVFYITGLVLFVAGLIMRWIAIIHLGRFFTVNIAITKDHKLITNGPYRFLRHPSYTGTLLMFFGFGLCMLNIFALVAVIVPITTAFLWRIHVEEAALSEVFGDRYRVYRATTARIIPWLY